MRKTFTETHWSISSIQELREALLALCFIQSVREVLEETCELLLPQCLLPPLLPP